MCEWLSCADWCDVRLMCGGQSFNAHRAVLASVSSFLRKVLLSCPVEESPVFIFLPEFDLDVLSFVLYYIYNGEVLIPNHKLQMFLDIANAMEIFIDQQYVPQRNYFNHNNLESKTDSGIFRMTNNNICRLSLCNGNHGCFITVKKDIDSEPIRQTQKSVGSLNFLGDPLHTLRWSGENITDLGNLTSVSGYRQRASFLRDLFIKTYSEDGNVNGQTPGVLAISNEECHVPTSVLFNKANEIQLSAYEKLINKVNRTAAQSIPTTSIINYLKHLLDNDHREDNTGDINISYTVSKLVKNANEESILGNNSKTENDINLWKIYEPLGISLPLLPKASSSNFSLGSKTSDSNLRHQELSDLKSIIEPPKVTIQNKVLQNPWHPQQPNNYRPFCKKVPTYMLSDEHHTNKDSLSCKFSNNNGNSNIKTNINVREEQTFSEQQELKCTVCMEVFTRRQDFSIHVRRHSSTARYKCDECQKTFSQLRNYKYHMSVHRGTKEFAASCSVCGKHFNDRGYLSNHMKIHRNRKEYKCASCPKSFNQRVAFNMHVRIHTGLKPHVCEECGKAFSRKMLLKQHLRTHSGERPYACAHCDKRFADRSNMTLHLRLHTGVKPFSCTLCPKSFTKKHHLKSHLNFHTGAKPYSCPRCKLAFTQSSNMRTHFKKCNAIN